MACQARHAECRINSNDHKSLRCKAGEYVRRIDYFSGAAQNRSSVC